jgi:hypothetical protein
MKTSLAADWRPLHAQWRVLHSRHAGGRINYLHAQRAMLKWRFSIEMASLNSEQTDEQALSLFGQQFF